jgi:peptide/nickel transport system permease protein
MATAAAAVTANTLPQRRGRPWYVAALRHRSLVAGATIIALILLAALFAPLLATHNPTTLDSLARFTPPGPEYLLGTDNHGRDTFSRALYGSHVSLRVGSAVSLLTIVLGTCVGLLAGYFRRLDGLLMRIMDSMMAFPGVILALAIMAARGASEANVVLALSVVYIPRLARVVRSMVLSVREFQYVEAARSIGTSNARILTRHILPNCVSLLIVQGTFIFAEAVLGEASLSFLGAGTPPEIPSWGNMLGEARTFLSSAPWTMLVPGACLMLAVLGLNLLGDGIRDLLDPRLRKL